MHVRLNREVDYLLLLYAIFKLTYYLLSRWRIVFKLRLSENFFDNKIDRKLVGRIVDLIF